MKKFILTLLLFISSFTLFSESYKIEDYKFNITGSGGISFGKTNEAALLMKYPLDTKTIFSSKDSFYKYLNNYKQQLKNTRAFSSIDFAEEEIYDDKNNLTSIYLTINLKDSNHFLLVPYPKYSSNSGFELKLKLKDTNFLGSLNPLSSDLFVNWNEENRWKFGINFKYDYPFKAGIFNAEWANVFNINYTIGEKYPDLSTSLGLNVTLPLESFALKFGAYQKYKLEKVSINTTNLVLQLPINIYNAPNFSQVQYIPYSDLSFNYTKPQDNLVYPNNNELKFGQIISNEKINWNENYRKGYAVQLKNEFVYDFVSPFVVPSISFEGKFYYNFNLLNKCFLNKIGINSQLYGFSVVEVPNRYENNKDNEITWKGNQKLGNRMRGIKDKDFQESPLGFVLNLDFPLQIITTNFTKDLFNFTMQMSPFIDIALTSNNPGDFNLYKKDLTTGLEILVFPKLFSGYTIRASIGFDMKKAIKSDDLFKSLLTNNEIFIGLDLHY